MGSILKMHFLLNQGKFISFLVVLHHKNYNFFLDMFDQDIFEIRHMIFYWLAKIAHNLVYIFVQHHLLSEFIFQSFKHQINSRLFLYILLKTNNLSSHREYE